LTIIELGNHSAVLHVDIDWTTELGWVHKWSPTC